MTGATNVVIVVGRDRGELFEYFRWGLGHTPGVDVVLDRRLGERRGRRNGRPRRTTAKSGTRTR